MIFIHFIISSFLNTLISRQPFPLIAHSVSVPSNPLTIRTSRRWILHFLLRVSFSLRLAVLLVSIHLHYTATPNYTFLSHASFPSPPPLCAISLPFSSSSFSPPLSSSSPSFHFLTSALLSSLPQPPTLHWPYWIATAVSPPSSFLSLTYNTHLNM